ncbi:MAG: hypothetical protein COU11_04150 [Candidatus Harrisonbacteria bacterium CG10_big_fil_rev_8_21_14_0_10_49_15]|uniref:MBG domain-containing protein n=1 Tax=Candidatus Harrisonbacteria bacterium CG10_big_fil_rev_8_21_14_0_10_49_15 TaxID=1974587 RepID=A0A2H0ULL2_9BACT|nr:MAG: hypothetical protein COU11_04150 [Candidatus Harrisonbacteria bacterium CG10_big_fil_rev_8_21_14_0_10_49_15]
MFPKRKTLKVALLSLFVLNLALSPLSVGAPIAQASECTYEFSPSNGNINLTADRQTQYITVTTSPNCYVQIDASGTVQYNRQWLNIGFSRKGSSRIGFDLMANTRDIPRTATLTIAGKEFKVVQSDGTLRGSLSVDTKEVAPGEPATLSWSTSNANTVRIEPQVGAVGATGSVAVRPNSNTTYTLTATTATGDKVTQSATVSVTPCAYTLSEKAFQISAGGDTKKVSVTTSPACEWYATKFWNTFGTAKPGPWPANISSTIEGKGGPNNSMLGSGSITYTFPANTTPEKRNLTAQIAKQTVTFSQDAHDFKCELATPKEKETFKYGLTKAELEKIYQDLKSGKEKPFITAGTTGKYPEGWDERFTPLANLACTGMVRIPINGNLNSAPDYGALRLAWSVEDAASHGFKDIAPDEYRRLNQIPHRFLAPTYVADTMAASSLGKPGSPQTVVFAPSELFTVIPFTALEKDLGHEPSNATTPGLYDDTPYRASQEQIEAGKKRAIAGATTPEVEAVTPTSAPVATSTKQTEPETSRPDPKETTKVVTKDPVKEEAPRAELPKVKFSSPLPGTGGALSDIAKLDFTSGSQIQGDTVYFIPTDLSADSEGGLLSKLWRIVDPEGKYKLDFTDPKMRGYFRDALSARGLEISESSATGKWIVEHPYSSGLAIGVVSATAAAAIAEVATTASLAYLGGAGTQCVSLCGETIDKILKNIHNILLNSRSLVHMFERHTVGGAEVTKTSSLFISKEVNFLLELIVKADSVPAVRQVLGNNFQRVVDAGRVIGYDGITKLPTSVYTIITDATGKLITGFPGLPR